MLRISSRSRQFDRGASHGGAGPAPCPGPRQRGDPGTGRPLAKPWPSTVPWPSRRTKRPRWKRPRRFLRSKPPPRRSSSATLISCPPGFAMPTANCWWPSTTMRPTGETAARAVLGDPHARAHCPDDKLLGTVELCFEPLPYSDHHLVLVRRSPVSPDRLLPGRRLPGDLPLIRISMRRSGRSNSKVMPDRVRDTLNTVGEGVLVLDKDERIALANEAFAKTIGKSAHRIAGPEGFRAGLGAGPVGAATGRISLAERPPRGPSSTRRDPGTAHAGPRPAHCSVNSTGILGMTASAAAPWPCSTT